MQRGSPWSRPAFAHLSDVHALAEGAEEAPRRGVWKTILGNILRNHRWKQGVPKSDLRTLLQYVEKGMGGEIAESTQEGEEVACGLVKEAVLRQILQHLLSIHSKEEDDHVLLLAEEQLDTLQALLEEEAPRVDKPPLLRSRVHTNTTPVESDHAEEPSISNGREATAMSSPSLTVD